MDKVREVTQLLLNKLYEQGLCVTEINDLPAANYLKVSQAIIEALATDNWQLIETAPKDGTEIIIYSPQPKGSFNSGYGCAIWVEKGWFMGTMGTDESKLMYANCNPTHWQPLPNPPKKGE